MNQSARRSILIYSVGGIILIFIIFMAFLEAEEVGRQREQTATAWVGTSAQLQIQMPQTLTATARTPYPTSVFTATPYPTTRP